MSISLSLEGKVALVTGGARGIGRATVRIFVQAGSRVLFNYQRAQAEAEGLVNELGRSRCVAMAADLEEESAAQKLVTATVERFGGLDILVANHGIWVADDVPIDQMSEKQWRRTMAINLDSVFRLLKHSVAVMKARASARSPARIVLISSTAGQRGEALHSDYAATKGALISLVKGLSTELARDHIYVNCVAPGWVDTDMSRGVLADKEREREILAKIPLGRVGTAEEIASPILFLSTPHAGFITGEIFNVNGGAVLVG